MSVFAKSQYFIFALLTSLSPLQAEDAPSPETAAASKPQARVEKKLNTGVVNLKQTLKPQKTGDSFLDEVLSEWADFSFGMFDFVIDAFKKPHRTLRESASKKAQLKKDAAPLEYKFGHDFINAMQNFTRCLSTFGPEKSPVSSQGQSKSDSR